MIPRTKPINIICDSGVNQNQVNAVIDGIKELLQIAEVGKDVKINNFGVWRHKEWKDGEDLIPYHSVDWYAEDAFTGRQNEMGDYQLHSGLVLDSFCDEPWQKSQPHYDVMITSLDLYAEGCNWVLGSAFPLTGTVLSTYRWRKLSNSDQYNLIRTEATHEMGHVFGLPDRNRKDLENSIGNHCRNRCVMRQGLKLKQWVDHTHDRISHETLCPQCKEDIYRFFRQT